MIDRIELKNEIEKACSSQGEVVTLLRNGGPCMYVRIEDELIEIDGKIFSFWFKKNVELSDELSAAKRKLSAIENILGLKDGE